jgi:hypothetical protein
MADQLADPDKHYVRVIEELVGKFAGVHERDAVVQAVDDARRELEANAQVTSYLPVLTQKLARMRLADPRVRVAVSGH